MSEFIEGQVFQSANLFSWYYSSAVRREQRLAVESQEVVLIKASAADGWSAFETTMRAMPVVVVQPGKKPGIALLGVEIGAGVDPLAESRLDESFGFTVGAGSVRTSEVMT